MASNCLRVSHFPENLNSTDKEELLKHFGATSVQFVGQKNSLAFAKFESENAASAALKRLHQLEVLGTRLTAAYAKNKTDDWSEVPGSKDQGASKTNEADSQKCYEKFLQSLNAWSLPMDLAQPPPSHLMYLYPPPTIEVAANIVCALVAVPKFYTQVLHLMNKMNLPSPFHKSSPEFKSAIHSFFGMKYVQEAPKAAAVNVEDIASPKSTSESEMESDTEEPNSTIPNFIPVKRKSSSKVMLKRPKLIKLQKGDNSAARATVNVSDVFEVAEKGTTKNITVKLGARDEVITETPAQPEGFGILFPEVPESTKEEEPRQVEEEEDDSYISIRKLRSNRVPERDRESLPVYRNYQAGAPSSRLYIKNLAKTTTARELHYIFRAFIGHKPCDEEENKMFNVLHMTEGRMKGQAFVTFPTVDQAQNALKETNGYILNEKPMVIQFGHSKKAKAE